MCIFNFFPPDNIVCGLYKLLLLFKYIFKHLSIAKFLYLNVLAYYIFGFFYVHKKKVLDLRKFSTSSFLWIYMFSNVLNMIWPFLENICLLTCLYVCLQNFVDTVSQDPMHGNWWNFIFSCTLIKFGPD